MDRNNRHDREELDFQHIQATRRDTEAARAFYLDHQSRTPDSLPDVIAARARTDRTSWRFLDAIHDDTDPTASTNFNWQFSRLFGRNLVVASVPN